LFKDLLFFQHPHHPLNEAFYFTINGYREGDVEVVTPTAALNRMV